MTIGYRSLTVLVFLLTFSVAAKVVKFERGDTTVYDFQIDDVLATTVEAEGEQYFRASFKGVEGYEGILYKKGHAEIPVVRFYADAINEADIEITFAKGAATRSSLEKEIYPAQESIEKIAGSKVEFVKDVAFYKSNQFWPEKNFSVEKMGVVNGKPQFMVTVYPLQYLPSKNSYRLNPNFTVEVKNAPLMIRKGQEQKDLFVMVVAQQFKNSDYIAEYAAFKRKVGFNVEILVVGDDVNSDDDIRASLQERLGNGLKYAMLIGEHDEVPSHDATHISGVTDHYYRAIDTENYQDDINGPDIGVGRITPKNEDELRNTLHKFIRYQVGDFAREEWLTKSSFIATNDRWQVAEGTHNYAIETYLEGLGYMGNFPEAQMPGGDRLYAITHDASDETVVGRIQQGRFLINYSGHGSTTTWAGPKVNQDDVRSLDDQDVLPFVVSNACITGQFTINESFGETWIKHPAGAIMFWGSMDSSYWDEDDIMEKRMYDGIYNDGLRTFSAITQNALLELWKHYGGEGRMKYYWETYVVFGDPSIELRTWTPEVPNFEGADVLPIGVPNLKYVLTNDQGRPFADTKVSLLNEEGTLLSIATTNQYGEVNLSTEGAVVGETLQVIAFGKNLKMQPFDVLVVSPDAPYLVAKDYTFGGEKPGFLSPFQRVNLGMVLENVSEVGTDGATLKIIKIEGNAKVVSKLADIPALDGHETYQIADDSLSFDVGDAVNGEKIEISFRWKTKEGDKAEFKKSFIVARALVSVAQVDFGNIEDPTVGGMAPGEQGDIYVTLTNSGSAPIKNGVFNFSPRTCLEAIDGEVEVDYLAAGETKRFEVAVSVAASASCGNADTATFEMSGQYQDLYADLTLSGNGSFLIGKMGRAVSEQDNIDLPITDKNTTSYHFEAPGIDKITDITVHVRITHTYQGDLEIRLLHSSGKSVVLRERSGGGTDNIDESYQVSQLVPAEELMELSSEGQWTLEVEDKMNSDQGTLDYVKVDVFGYIK